MASLPGNLPGLGQGDEYVLVGEADRLYDAENDAKIVDWRITVLEGAGFDTARASALAMRRDVDLREAERLVKAGATPEQASLILL